MLAFDPACPPPPSLVSLAPNVLPSVDPALSRPPGPWDTSTNVTPNWSEHSCSPPLSPCLPTCHQDGPGWEAESEVPLGRPSISDLPPELLARVLTHVGLVGGPAALRSCLLVCRGFHDVIQDPAADKYVRALISPNAINSLILRLGTSTRPQRYPCSPKIPWSSHLPPC